MNKIILHSAILLSFAFISENSFSAKNNNFVTSDVKKGEALKPSKNLNFEERRVEAVNTRPLDSFQHVAERRSESDSRLYDKPITFQNKNKYLLKSIGSQ